MSSYRWYCQSHEQEMGDEFGCLIGARESIAEFNVVAVKASELLRVIDNITTEDFSYGADKEAREALRTTLKDIP